MSLTRRDPGEIALPTRTRRAQSRRDRAQDLVGGVRLEVGPVFRKGQPEGASN